MIKTEFLIVSTLQSYFFSKNLKINHVLKLYMLKQKNIVIPRIIIYKKFNRYTNIMFRIYWIEVLLITYKSHLIITLIFA